LGVGNDDDDIAVRMTDNVACLALCLLKGVFLRIIISLYKGAIFAPTIRTHNTSILYC
jgi:hypothetical protein